MYFGLGWLRSAAHWYAFMCWSVWNPKREPWTSLEPLLICKSDCGASRQALFSVEGVGNDGDLLHGLERGNICEGAIDDSAAVGPIYRKIIDVRRRAIDGEVHRAGRVRGEGACVLRV